MGAVALSTDITEADNQWAENAKRKKGKAELIKPNNIKCLELPLKNKGFRKRAATMSRKIAAHITRPAIKTAGPKVGTAILMKKNDEPQIAANKINVTKCLKFNH
jgi:hypothetical protein